MKGRSLSSSSKARDDREEALEVGDQTKAIDERKKKKKSDDRRVDNVNLSGTSVWRLERR